MHEHQAVNFKSDAEHVTPEFYNLIKKSMKSRIVNRKQQNDLTNLFNESTWQWYFDNCKQKQTNEQVIRKH